MLLFGNNDYHYFLLGPLELDLTMKSVRALCSLSHPAMFSAPPMLTDAQKQKQQQQQANSAPSDAVLADAAADDVDGSGGGSIISEASYWNSTRSLHVSIQLPGVQAKLLQTNTPLVWC